jgi:hydrogenase expression/formation protein HypE
MYGRKLEQNINRRHAYVLRHVNFEDYCRNEMNLQNQNCNPDRFHVIMTGWAGMEKTADACREDADILKGRLSRYFLKEAADLIDDMEHSETLSDIIGSLCIDIRKAGDGGIFSSLWDVGAEYSCGIRAFLDKIPIKQITIEVCEILDINPYLAKAGGSLIAVTDKPDEVLKVLYEENVNASDIGRLSDKPDRLVINGQELRNLEPYI